MHSRATWWEGTCDDDDGDPPAMECGEDHSVDNYNDDYDDDDEGGGTSCFECVLT